MTRLSFLPIPFLRRSKVGQGVRYQDVKLDVWRHPPSSVPCI